MDAIVGIYKITSPSKSVYIGQSVNIPKRFRQYQRLDCKSQPRVYNSLRKHGVEKHRFDILCQCDLHELNEMEAFYVDLYQSFNHEKGMNLKSGGSSTGHHSEETRRKISLANTGKKKTAAENEWNRIRQLGEKSHRYGVKFTKEHRGKISKALMGHEVSISTREKISIARSKPIEQHSLDGVFIKQHNSTLEAARELNVNPLAITACLNGRSKTSCGFIWRKITQE
jgi:group I intron endonuclease